MGRFVKLLILVPVAIVLVTLAVANRGAASFTIDPFNPGNPGLSFTAPLFVLLFLAMVAGVILGGAATWMRQGRFRKAARHHESEARKLRDQMARPRPVQPAPPALPGA